MNLRASTENMQFDTLIIGGGQAGVQVARSLRDLGYDGTVAIVDSQAQAPYERPPLSKAYLRGEADVSDLLFRPEDYWGGAGIELILGQAAKSVDVVSHSVALLDGTKIHWGNLVWAAGGVARRLPLGPGLAGVHSLRNLRDADSLRANLASAKSAVIVGGGFIGLEAAAAFRLRGLAVTVIEAQDRLLARVTSPVVSDFYARLHRDNGVDVRLRTGIESVDGAAGHVTSVTLSEGERLSAELVLVGIGQIANVQPLADAGLSCGNGVEVDVECRTSNPEVFACGDCATRVSPYSVGSMRLESVPNATDQGKIVAAVIAGAPLPPAAPPWFWSHQYETRLQTVGLFTGYDDMVVRGDSSAGGFSVVYLREGRVVALDCVNSVRDFAQGKLVVAEGAAPARRDLEDSGQPLKNLLLSAPAA